MSKSGIIRMVIEFEVSTGNVNVAGPPNPVVALGILRLAEHTMASTFMAQGETKQEEPSRLWTPPVPA